MVCVKEWFAMTFTVGNWTRDLQDTYFATACAVGTLLFIFWQLWPLEVRYKIDTIVTRTLVCLPNGMHSLLGKI